MDTEKFRQHLFVWLCTERIAPRLTEHDPKLTAVFAAVDMETDRRALDLDLARARALALALIPAALRAWEYAGGESLAAVELDGQLLARLETGNYKLAMNRWHTCETTHCRAGHYVDMAGRYDLEALVGSGTAGAMIFLASYPERPIPNFYADNEAAMADIVSNAGQVPEAA